MPGAAAKKRKVESAEKTVRQRQKAARVVTPMGKTSSKGGKPTTRRGKPAAKPKAGGSPVEQDVTVDGTATSPQPGTSDAGQQGEIAMLRREVSDLREMMQDLIGAVRDGSIMPSEQDSPQQKVPKTNDRSKIKSTGPKLQTEKEEERALNTYPSDSDSSSCVMTKKRRRRKRKSAHDARSNKSSDSDKSSGSCRSCGSSISRYSSSFDRDPKLPKFTGQESWKVWFTRLEDIASRRMWDETKKLDVVTSRVDGIAADFVFDQLTKEERGDYKKLVKCLHTSFRKIEGEKAFQAMFWRRKQKAAESEELYAADLKRIYGKAFPRRDSDSRRDDLLRRFLSGLADSEASHNVEFVKDPSDIDEALDEVVKYRETLQPGYAEEEPAGRRRAARLQADDGTDSEMRVARVDGGRDGGSMQTDEGKGTKAGLVTMEYLHQQLQELKELLSRPRGQGQGQSRRRRGQNPIQCYACQGFGHIARECTAARQQGGQGVAPRGQTTSSARASPVLNGAGGSQQSRATPPRSSTGGAGKSLNC